MDRREFVKLAGLSVAALGLPIVAEEVTSIIYIMNDSRVVGFADSFDETAGHVNKMILNKIPVRIDSRLLDNFDKLVNKLQGEDLDSAHTGQRLHQSLEDMGIALDTTTDDTVDPELVPLSLVIAELPGSDAIAEDIKDGMNELKDVVFTRSIRQMKIGAYKTKHIENKMTVYTGVSLVKYSYSNV